MGSVRGYALPLIVIFVASVLILTMPAELLASGVDPYEVTLPEGFQSAAAIRYTDYYNVTLDADEFVDGAFGPLHEFTLEEVVWYVSLSDTLEYVALGRSIPFGVDWATFANVRGQSRGTTLEPMEMDADANLTDAPSMIVYHAACQGDASYKMDVLLGWNASQYATPSLAFLDETMIFLGATQINQTVTIDNGFELMYSILTFQLPDTPFPLNLLFAGIIYIPMASIIVMLIIDLKPL